MDRMGERGRLIMTGALVLSVVGAFIVLTEPFGGMTLRVRTGGVIESIGYRERYSSLGSEYSELPDNLFIVLLAVCMLAMALVSALVLVSGKAGLRKRVTMALALGIGTVLLAAAGGVSFDMVRADSSYEDWWLETGFYAAIIVGLANSAAYVHIMRRRKSAIETP